MTMLVSGSMEALETSMARGTRNWCGREERTERQNPVAGNEVEPESDRQH